MTDLDNVTGLAALGAAMDLVPAKMEANILRGGLRAGAKVQLAEAQRVVPVEAGGPHPGALRASLRVSTGVRAGTVRASVRAGGPSAWWAAMVEFGTAAHLIRPKGKKSLAFAAVNAEVVHHPGARKNPFMRVALDNTAVAAVTAVANYIRNRFTKQGIETPDPGD